MEKLSLSIIDLVNKGELCSAVDELISFFKRKDLDVEMQLEALKSKYNSAKNKVSIGRLNEEAFKRISVEISSILLGEYILKVDHYNKIYSVMEDKSLYQIHYTLQEQIYGLKSKLKINDLLSKEIDENNLILYLIRKFPGLPYDNSDGYFSIIYSALNLRRYKFIRDLDLILQLTEKFMEINKISADCSSEFLAISLGCIDIEYRNNLNLWNEMSIALFGNFPLGTRINSYYCSFCKGNKSERKILVAGAGNICICELCIDRAMDIKSKELK